MKRVLFFLLILCPLGLMAANPGFGERKYSLSGMVEYSYNKTWGHHANFDIQSLMPINPHFEMEARLQFSTANVYSGALQIRPKFELPVGELFLETDVYYRAIARNRIGDITAALGVGYRMDYVSITLGVFSRVIDDWNRSWATMWSSRLTCCTASRYFAARRTTTGTCPLCSAISTTIRWSACGNRSSASAPGTTSMSTGV